MSFGLIWIRWLAEFTSLPDFSNSSSSLFSLLIALGTWAHSWCMSIGLCKSSADWRSYRTLDKEVEIRPQRIKGLFKMLLMISIANSSLNAENKMILICISLTIYIDGFISRLSVTLIYVSIFMPIQVVWLFGVFYGFIQILRLFFLFLRKMLLEFW